MKFIIFFIVILISFKSFAECDRRNNESNGETVAEPKTIFGGCTYFSPIIRVGYSSEYSGYFGIGGILPLNQSSDWEGAFSENGIAYVASIYEDGEIYDIGYAKRNGWAIFSTGWDLGVFYRNAEVNRHGVYFGYTLIGSLSLRYLKGDIEEKMSLDLGLKL